MDKEEIARDLTVALAKRADVILSTKSTNNLTEVAKATVYLYKEILKALE